MQAWYHSSGEDEEFGPGAALVLSLFAVLILVAAVAWRDIGASQAALPVSLIDIAEGGTGQGYFEVGSARLNPQAQAAVQAVLRAAVRAATERRARRTRGANHFQVIGYASPEGAGNLALAERRALAVRDYLLGLGVPVECIVTASYGDSHSPLLKQWLGDSRTLADFRALGSAAVQRRALTNDSQALTTERRVSILAVFHSDSTCRLDLIRTQ